ncbi:MAG: peptidylprolyl isomerase [bacterium]|nr:peptidylprolyl isomerase [bacterium]
MKKSLVLLILVIFLLGCSSEESTETSVEIENSEGIVMEEIQENQIYAVMETSKGTIKVLLYEETAITKENFVSLIEEGFYNGLTFHRYEPGFVIQGGDPNGDGTGGSEKTIALEVVGKSHSRGTVGMARSSDPNSASSQFFFNLADNTFLDSGYTVFGEVTEGLDVMDYLRAGDTITSITISQT